MILYIVFTALGIFIGFAISHQIEHPVPPKDDLQKEINKLKLELAVYQNLKDSLLEDIRYWRNKAEDK